MKMRRTDRLMPEAAAREYLKDTAYGVLSMCHEGVPYAVPLNHYLEGDTLYFHAATVGRKLSFIAANPRVCYVVAEMIELKGVDSGEMCNVSAYYRSVIVFGTARLIEDPVAKAKIVSNLTRHLTDDKLMDAPDVAPQQTDRIAIIAVDIEEISGKAQLP